MSIPSLPQINSFDTYAFPVTLPSTKQSISLRPYLVREEKLLLMAQESENSDEQAEAVSQIIKNCTNGLVDPRTAPFFDVEYLLLQLRARSVGDVATPTYVCNNEITENGNTTKCGNRTTVRIPLNNINVVGDITPGVINISPKMTLKLRYPSIFTVSNMFEASIIGGNPKASAIDALADLFDTLTDSDKNIVYKFDDYSQPDKIAFLESLVPGDYEKVISFFENMPTIQHLLEYTCEKCKYEHKIKLSGLSDFLV